MALTQEDLLAIATLMDAKLDPINERLDKIERQIKVSEKKLTIRIDSSETLLLDEIERVHEILDKHVQDTKKHLA
ncbi:MAG: hypothetical protein KH031_09820 [Clostridiales bacterium]|nr:hypothetical protein [Clostridiales bacterium]